MASQDGPARMRVAAARRRVALAGAVIILAAGCASAPSAAPATTERSIAPATAEARPSRAATSTPALSPTASPGLTWLYGEAGFMTSVLWVPLDYEHPDGTQIPISIGRRAATDPAHRIGTLVYLPGGPGDQGVEALRTMAETLFTDAVRERFDIVAFDARGNPVDALGPNVSCPLDGALPAIAGDPRKSTDLVATTTAWSGQLANACASASGEILPLVGTANVIADIDRLREALGEDKLSFVGISYGTVTGVRYAERYPEHVRALILDAPVDLALDAGGFQRASVTTLQRLFDEFLAACAADVTCAIHADGRPREAFEALVAARAAGPVDGISAADLWQVLRVGLGQPDQLDEWLAAIRDGDTTEMKALLKNEPDKLGYSIAISCIDLDHPRTADGVDSRVAELRRVAPDFAWEASYALRCVRWPVATETPAAPVTATGAPPTLVIGSTDDPSTPYAWAVSVAKALESGVLLTRAGHGHGSIYADNACVDGITDAYLLNLSQPTAGATCS